MSVPGSPPRLLAEAGSVLAAIALHAGIIAWLGMDVRQQGAIDSEVASVSLNLIETPIIEDVLQGETASASTPETKAAAAEAAPAVPPPPSETEPEPKQEPDPPTLHEPVVQPDKPEPVQELPQHQPPAEAEAAPPLSEQVAEGTLPEDVPPKAVPPVPTKPQPSFTPPVPRPKPVAELPKQEPAPVNLRPTEPRSKASKASVAQTSAAASAQSRGSKRGRTKGDPAQSTGARRASPGQARAYAARVQAKIARRRPRGQGLTGTVVVAFSISNSGALASARIVRSSGNRGLDNAAVASVRSAAPFPKPPAGMTRQQLSFTIPFRFR